MTTSQTVIAIDPGLTTGVVEWHSADEELKALRYHVFSIRPEEFEQESGAITEWLTTMRQRHRPLTIIIENFRLRPDKAEALTGDQMYTSQLLGILRHHCYWVLGGTQVILQEPGVQDYPFNDAVLRKIGLWPTNRHKRSALKHFLYFLKKQRHPWLEQQLRLLARGEL